MLRVTLELVPEGDDVHATTLDVLEIAAVTKIETLHDGTLRVAFAAADDSPVEDYVARLKQPHDWRRVEWTMLREWPRLRLVDAWDLVTAALLCGQRTSHRDELLEELRRRGLA